MKEEEISDQTLRMQLLQNRALQVVNESVQTLRDRRKEKLTEEKEDEQQAKI